MSKASELLIKALAIELIAVLAKEPIAAFVVAFAIVETVVMASFAVAASRVAFPSLVAVADTWVVVEVQPSSLVQPTFQPSLVQATSSFVARPSSFAAATPSSFLSL